MQSAKPVSAAILAPIQTPAGIQAVTILAVIVVWEFIGRTGLLFPDLFPSIAEILQSLWLYVTTPIMIPHIKASLYEVGGAVGIACLLGVPLGILWGSKQSWLEIVEPLILYAAVVPKIVIFPVFILFLGIDVHSKLAVGPSRRFFPFPF
jgi:ABC-type nitrate/sulfonate/bicarbonate transport system permease component